MYPHLSCFVPSFLFFVASFRFWGSRNSFFCTLVPVFRGPGTSHALETAILKTTRVYHPHRNNYVRKQIPGFGIFSLLKKEGESKRESLDLCWVRAASGPFFWGTIYSTESGFKMGFLSMGWSGFRQKWVFGCKSG